jgi:hypothetical protein
MWFYSATCYTVKILGLFITEKIYKQNITVVRFEDLDFNKVLILVPMCNSDRYCLSQCAIHYDKLEKLHPEIKHSFS